MNKHIMRSVREPIIISSVAYGTICDCRPILVGPVPNINRVGHPMCIDYIANN